MDSEPKHYQQAIPAPIHSITLPLTTVQVLGLQSGKKIEEILQAVTHIVDIESSPEYKVCPVFDSTLVGKLVFRHRPKSEVTTTDVFSSVITIFPRLSIPLL